MGCCSVKHSLHVTSVLTQGTAVSQRSSIGGKNLNAVLWQKCTQESRGSPGFVQREEAAWHPGELSINEVQENGTSHRVQAAACPSPGKQRCSR